MEAIIRYLDGRRVEAAVLTFGTHCMRVAPRGQDDAVELSFSYGQWTDEEGEIVEFDSLLAGDACPVVMARGSGSRPG